MDEVGGGSVRGNVEKRMLEFLEAMISPSSTFVPLITESIIRVPTKEHGIISNQEQDIKTRPIPLRVSR